MSPDITQSEPDLKTRLRSTTRARALEISNTPTNSKRGREEVSSDEKGDTRRLRQRPDESEAPADDEGTGPDVSMSEQASASLPVTRRSWRQLAQQATSSEDEMAQIRQTDVTVHCTRDSTLPERATTGAAGWDCRANQTLTIQPGRTAKVDLGLRISMPPGLCMLLISRSRLASEGLTVQGGLIDSDYRGPILCLLHNSTCQPRIIQKGERICQAIFLNTPTINWEVTSSLDGTARGDSGFGSTGKY